MTLKIDILAKLDETTALVAETKALVEQLPDDEGEPEPEPATLVQAGDDLQAAMNGGGVLQLAQEADFGKVGGFGFTTPSTSLIGLGNNAVLGTRGPVFRCGLGFQGGRLEALEVRVSEYDQSMLRFGINGTEQDTVLKTPRNLRFLRVTVPEFRGKRAFEINAADVEIEDCSVRDVFAPAGVDSQAVWIFNTPGSIHVKNCYLEAASENLMVGGDKIKLVDARPTNILIEDSVFTKPLAWKTAGTPKVKTLLELKDGWDVIIRRCLLSHSWKSGQDGFGFTFTPSQGGRVKVRVEECEMWEVGSICNITGQDQGGYYPNEPRSQIHFVGGKYRTNKAGMGGRGVFALITHGPESVIVENVQISNDGSSFILIGDGKPIDRLHVLGCAWDYGTYGIFINGYSHGDNSLGVIKDFRVEGCTIRGAHSAFKARFPNNTYVSMMTEAQEREKVRMVEDDPIAQIAQWATEYQL